MPATPIIRRSRSAAAGALAASSWLAGVGWLVTASPAATTLPLEPPTAATSLPVPLHDAPSSYESVQHESVQHESVQHLEALARNEAALQFPALTARQRFVVGPIDARLQLQKCGGPVTPALPSPHHMPDRVTVELRCQDLKSWHLYVPVRIVGTSPVAVTLHAIVTGSIIKASDLKVEEHDVSELPLGFFDDPAAALGLTASRPITGGAYLTNQQLLAPKAVQRGQSVTLLADGGGIAVRMAGRALADGLVNQRVKVQNLSSGKIVEGIARSEQVVEIISQ